MQEEKQQMVATSTQDIESKLSPEEIKLLQKQYKKDLKKQKINRLKGKMRRAFSPKIEKPRIWERRGQTFEQYQKRPVNDGTVYPVNPSKHIKKEPDPNSLTSLKIKFLLDTGNKITRHALRIKLDRKAILQ